VLHAAMSRALRKAVKDRVLTVSPAVDLEWQRPQKDAGIVNAKLHCWNAVEARRVVEAAKLASPQMAAFAFLALDSGARRSELNGLTWSDVDFDADTLTISRQLDAAGAAPTWGPTKNKKHRVVALNPETVERLQLHKRSQAALKMKNRTTYTDFNLIFAKENEDLQTADAKLGQPLTTLTEGRFVKLLKDSNVRRIKFHGLRHTCATLLLQGGVPPHVVAARLGHSVMELMKTYAHALPMQQDAAARLGQVLHG
jgi:integrase